MVGKKYKEFSKVATFTSEQQQYDLMLANLKSTPSSALAEKLRKDSIVVDKFDTTIQSIEVKQVSDSQRIIGTYFDDIMMRPDDVKGKKEITLNSQMINMGSPQALCVGLPKIVTEFACKYVSENLFLKELKRYEDLSE